MGAFMRIVLLTPYFLLLTSHCSTATWAPSCASYSLLLTSYFLLLTSAPRLCRLHAHRTPYFLLLTSYFSLLTAAPRLSGRVKAGRARSLERRVASRARAETGRGVGEVRESGVPSRRED